MNTGIILEALAAGGKTAFKISAAGFTGLLVYSYLVNDKIVYLPFALMCIAVASGLLGGIRGGLSAGNLGWLHGFMVAALYSVVITLIRLLFFPSSGFDQASLMLNAVILAAGSIGGVAGINARFILRKKKRYLGY